MVVGTAVIMTLTFFAGMTYMMIKSSDIYFVDDAQKQTFEKIFMAFTVAGSNAMAFLFGILVNTRSQPAEPIKTDATIVNTARNPAKTKEVVAKPTEAKKATP